MLRWQLGELGGEPTAPSRSEVAQHTPFLKELVDFTVLYAGDEIVVAQGLGRVDVALEKSVLAVEMTVHDGDGLVVISRLAVQRRADQLGRVGGVAAHLCQLALSALSSAGVDVDHRSRLQSV